MCSAFISALFVVPSTAFATFSDVTEDHPYFDAITTLETEGIIRGYNNNLFLPDTRVSKAELLKIVFNHAGYSPDIGIYETPFTDVPPESWFAPYVKMALDLNLIRVNPNVPKFFPEQPISRIEGLKLILPLEGIPAPLTSENEDIIFEDIALNSLYTHYVRAAQNTGIFIPEEQPFFFPHRLLTRGEAAELLYRAQIYREIVGDPITLPIEEMLTSPDSGTGSDFINNAKFPIFLNVWTKINTESLYKEEIDPDQLIYGAISGMVEEIGDEHAVFQDPDEAIALLDSLNGTYEGIGTVIDEFEDEFLIITVMKNSPAEEAGLQEGDIILEVDGHEVGDLTIVELINNIKGPSGSVVEIKVRRDKQTKTLDVTRGQIDLDTVFFEGGFEIPGDIGYIAIYQFTESTSGEFRSMLDETLSNDPKGLIIDLRDNPGGQVEAAYQVLDLFIEEGEILAKMGFPEYLREANSNGPGDAGDTLPIMVLINANTASAAEIVAGALQDHKIGTLIGEPTYGKGTVQEVNTYNDGSVFKFTIAEWFTPLDHQVDKNGLTPDILVERTKDDVLGNTDSQLDRAIEELKKKL